MKTDSFLIHVAFAGGVAFFASVLTWRLLGVDLPFFTFLLAGVSPALAGAVIGWVTGKYLITTCAVTLFLRIAITFFLADG